MRRFIASLLAVTLVIVNFVPQTVWGRQVPAMEEISVEDVCNETPIANAMIGSTIGEDDEWTLVWSDEFEGGCGSNFHNGLDLRTWEIQTGNGATMGLTGWGNNEVQYYHQDNVWVEDGVLHIEARRETITSPTEGTFHFTSGRIRSVGTYGIGTGFQMRYGRIEARISLPYGQGLWPAFWMMPQYDVYGTWAASGEIDIMEARGREPFYSTSAIHYGGRWPHNTYSAGYVDLRDVNPDLTINSFINYAVEWEPGEMRFLVDDYVFWTVNDWHALAHGQEDLGVSYMFPAPFDQYFHMLLNLAVGGWFDGGVLPGPEFDDYRRLMRVEYVRVYELTGRPMRYPAPPTLTPDEEPADMKGFIEPGGQIWDVNFSNVVDEPVPPVYTATDVTNFGTRDGWELFSYVGGGIGAHSVGADGMLHIPLSNSGVLHANQLMQRVSLVHGWHYRLQFDARAAAPRQINARLGMGRPTWGQYSNFNPHLTTETQTFTHYFTMRQGTDIHARLEFNLGQSSEDVWIGNVSLVRVPYVQEDIDVVRTPLPDGNMMWNGEFNQGTYGTLFWSQTGADFHVDRVTRALSVANVTPNAMISQSRIPMSNDTFNLSFDAVGTGTIGVRIVNMVTGQVHYTTTLPVGTVSHDFTLSGVPLSEREMRIELLFGGVTSDLILNHVRLERLTNDDRDFAGIRQHLLDNGDFFAGLRSWEHASIYGGASTVTFIPNGAAFHITALADLPHSILVMNDGHTVHSGHRYAVEFDISGVERDILFAVETPGFVRRVEQIIPVTGTTTTHRFEFNSVSNETLNFRFLMGAMGNAATGTVNITNARFYVVDAPLNPIPTFADNTTTNYAGTDITITYNHGSVSEFATVTPTISVNGVPATFTRPTAGTIIIPASYFGVGNHTISVAADGFETITFNQVTRQQIVQDPGNFLVNGNFEHELTGPHAGWWYGGAPLFTTSGGAFSLRYPNTGGLAIDIESAGTVGWGIFMNQLLEEGPLPAGNYVLQFDVRSTVPRAMNVEFGGGQAATVGQAITTEWTTVEIPITTAVHVRFLLGNIGVAAGVSHSVYFRNLSLREGLTTVELENLIAATANLNENDWTPSTWATFTAAREHAIAVLANVNHTQAQINAARTGLQNAYNGLVPGSIIIPPNAPNLLINGDFNSLPLGDPTGGWYYAGMVLFESWHAWNTPSWELIPGGGIELDLPNAGYLGWHVMLRQTLQTPLRGGNYALVFTASSTMPREISVEFGRAPSGVQQLTTVNLTTEPREIIVPITGADDVTFLLGDTATGANPHFVNVYYVALVDLTGTAQMAPLAILETTVEQADEENSVELPVGNSVQTVQPEVAVITAVPVVEEVGIIVPEPMFGGTTRTGFRPEPIEIEDEFAYTLNPDEPFTFTILNRGVEDVSRICLRDFVLRESVDFTLESGSVHVTILPSAFTGILTSELALRVYFTDGTFYDYVIEFTALESDEDTDGENGNDDNDRPGNGGGGNQPGEPGQPGGNQPGQPGQPGGNQPNQPAQPGENQPDGENDGDVQLDGENDETRPNLPQTGHLAMQVTSQIQLISPMLALGVTGATMLIGKQLNQKK